MAKAIVIVKNVNIAPGNVARVRYDMVIDQGGYQLTDIETDIAMSASTTQINNNIKAKAIIEAQGQAGQTLVNSDIVIFGGAQ